MKGRLLSFTMAGVMGVALFSSSLGLSAEKIQFATGVKAYHPYYLPVMAAEEKGLWKDNGLEVEWVPFRSTLDMFSAMASGSMNSGVGVVETFIRAAEKGLAALMVAELHPLMEYSVWVLADGPIKEVKDLSGRRVGVARLGSSSAAFGKIIAKRNGIEGKLKFVGTGGLVAGTAALVSKAVDAQVVAPYGAIAKLVAEGKVRKLVGSKDYLPKEWIDQALAMRKDFIREKPEPSKRLVGAFLQSVDFVKRNPAWSTEKIMAAENLSREVASFLFKYYEFTKDGKINPKAVENVRSFLIENGLLSQKAPPASELYTAQFTG